jgi:nicotinamidase-related amidase
MSSLHLDASKTALVMIDLQKGIAGRQTAPHPAREVVERSNRLAKQLRQKGGLIVYVRVNMADFLELPVDAPFRDPNAPPPPPDASELVPEAGYQAGDLVVTKRHWGAFAGTNLEQALRERNIETIVLTGISTNAGVESTLRQGTGLGFAFVVAEDACASLEEEAHRFSIEKTFPRLARVRKTDEVIEALS